MSRLALADRPDGALAVERPRATLAEAKRTDEVKQIRDVAVAMKAYARTQKAGKEIAIDAGEIILRADVRLGELARELPRAPPTAGPGRGKQNGVRSTDNVSKASALAGVGITRQRAAEFERVSKLPQTQLDAYISAELPRERESVRDDRELLAQVGEDAP